MSRGSRISGIGVYRPKKIVDNSQISERLNVSQEWIRKRSGITSRRYAGPDEPLSVMAGEAANNALEEAGISAEEVGCIIVATTTHLSQMPSLASAVAYDIGANQAGSFDILAACAGFPYGVAMASDMVKAGSSRHVLVIGAERITDILDPDDQSTAFLFADGAGAAVVSESESFEIGPVAWGTDGSRASAVGMTGHWVPKLRTDQDLPWPRLGMKGWRVYRWAVNDLAPGALRAISYAGVDPRDIDVFIPHQANKLITQELTNQIGFRQNIIVANDIEQSGNTSSASIPLALDELRRSGLAESGMKALAIGFGSGLVYAAQVVQIP